MTLATCRASIPEPMPCLLDACRSPLACQNFGQCDARLEDTWASWWLAHEECRRRGITDPFTRKGER